MTFFHLSNSVFKNLGAFLRAGAARGDADFGKRGLHVGILQRLGQGGVELGEHVGGQAGGSENAEPEIDLESLQSGFVEGRNVGIDIDALEAGGGDRPHAVVGGERQAPAMLEKANWILFAIMSV